MKATPTYFTDIRLFTSRRNAIALALLLISLLTLPIWIPAYLLYQVQLMAVHAIVALGLNLLVGNTGQISLGHAGFVMIGGYATVLLMSQLHIPFLLALILGGFISAVFGGILGISALRLSGPYLAIATLGFGLATGTLIGRFDIFGGRMGLSAPSIALDWTGMETETSIYYIIILITIAMTFLARNILFSRMGRAFQAIRDSEIAASSMGIHLAQYKTMSFAISAGFAGIAGGLWVFLIQFINPESFYFIDSIEFLIIIIIGGMGRISGSILGAIVFVFLDMQLKDIAEFPILGDGLVWISEHFMSLEGLPNVSWVCIGLILISLIMFEPKGLIGIWDRIERRFFHA